MTDVERTSSCISENDQDQFYWIKDDFPLPTR